MKHYSPITYHSQYNKKGVQFFSKSTLHSQFLHIKNVIEKGKLKRIT
jgi:hypothetical protein